MFSNKDTKNLKKNSNPSQHNIFPLLRARGDFDIGPINIYFSNIIYDLMSPLVNEIQKTLSDFPLESWILALFTYSITMCTS